MIIAPMTVAVESASTPAVAMIPESTSIVQNADCFARVSPDRRSRSSDSSSRVRRWFSGRTRSRRPMFMAPSMPLAVAEGRRVRRTRPGEPRRAPFGRTAGTVERDRRSPWQVPHHRRQHRHRAVVPGARPRGLLGRRAADPDADPVLRPHRPPPPARAPPRRPSTPTPTSSASPSGTASVPAGFSLDDVSSTALPEPRWRPRGDRRGAGGPAHRLRPGGVAVPRHRAARPSRCTTSTSRLADGSGDVVDVPRRRLPRGDDQLGRHPRGQRAAARNASAASLAGTVVAQARPVYGGFEAVGQAFVGVRGRERPFKVTVLTNPTRLVVDVYSG